MSMMNEDEAKESGTEMIQDFEAFIKSSKKIHNDDA